jgi:mRNA interferase RelE/StbE
MKTVRFTVGTAMDLRRHRDMAPGVRTAIGDYAAGEGSYAGDVTQLAEPAVRRMRIGGFRLIFDETGSDILVAKFTPSGGANEDLADARAHAIAMSGVAYGAKTFSDAELGDFLAAKTPMAYWRRRAKITQMRLAETAGVSQTVISQLEGGSRTGSAELYLKLARELNIRVEELVEG